MNGFERRKEQKRESIIQASLELFALYGFRKVSINDIAAKANVSPVTIYNHFLNKDNLVTEVVKYQFARMMDEYKKIIYGEGAFPEKIKEIIFNKVEIATQFRGELAPVTLGERNGVNKSVYEEFEEEVLKITLDLFDEGKREGYIGEHISEDAMIVYLEILRGGILSSTRLYANEEAYPRIIRELNELFLYGLIDTGDRPELQNKD